MINRYCILDNSYLQVGYKVERNVTRESIQEISTAFIKFYLTECWKHSYLLYDFIPLFHMTETVYKNKMVKRFGMSYK